jgi:hypothetical protein
MFTAPVRGIHAIGRSVGTALKTTCDKKRIGGDNPVALCRGETAAAAGESRLIVVNTPPLAFANILRTVAKRLVDRKDQAACVIRIDAAVDAIAPALGELDTEETEMSSR